MIKDYVRLRPGMYVGDTDDGSGLLNLVLEVVANSLDQWLAGRCARISVHVSSEGSIAVEDDGPGLRANGGDGVPPLATLLDEISVTPTVDGHRPHVHVGIGGMGLAVMQRLCDRFELVSVRDGERVCANYTRGVSTAPITVEASTQPNGTCVRFHPDPEIFHGPRVSTADIARRLDELAFLAPGLRISLSAEADVAAAQGLAGLVANRVRGTLGGIAHERGTYATERGPV
jgi:DNA gyrase subunit B